MKDCHVHTKISHDGISSILEYLEVASKIGVDEITFTEHYDDYTGVETSLETLDVDKYYKAYLSCASDSLVKTNFGIEIGLQPDIVSSIRKMVNSYPFDFIIGSSHITCKKDMSVDRSFFDGYTRKQAYLRYFEEVLQNIKLYDEFDVYGHLDYVVRYGGYDSKVIDYKEFEEILDEILISLISKGKGIEINTSGIRYGLGSPHPNIDILRRYRQLGGEIITMGSDAHRCIDLGKDFDMAFDMLEDVNLEYVSIFHQRKPEFVKVNKLRR